MPRPLNIPDQIYDHIYNREDISDYRREAEQMLETEIIQLLSFDNQNFAFPGCKAPKMKIFIEKFDENYLNQASELISKEIHGVKQENQNGDIDLDKWNQFLLSQEKIKDLKLYNMLQGLN
ncbi:myb-like DNA-binding domain protein [Ichthyophthirius multifiliis]|uniref:Myb-like DNA-binding domain protein n=1 Tax=Ichthyophthirius multifiliis TaxID=5932 RepID=G0QWI5_ICHMU|nr:myb-like DNA-binding domain protein [Ichthyophthirius multifiliis]EGR30414.1 myb-like DNA-binding domain protein [Ichthyophthirius multifiliis]|eukprot:XP_004032001.1 myb-like DNA-binding domain protein [Ichthyophthirius multifiliis]